MSSLLFEMRAGFPRNGQGAEIQSNEEWWRCSYKGRWLVSKLISQEPHGIATARYTEWDDDFGFSYRRIYLYSTGDVVIVRSNWCPTPEAAKEVVDQYVNCYRWELLSQAHSYRRDFLNPYTGNELGKHLFEIGLVGNFRGTIDEFYTLCVEEKCFVAYEYEPTPRLSTDSWDSLRTKQL
jgi:hypothetical protein